MSLFGIYCLLHYDAQYLNSLPVFCHSNKHNRRHKQGGIMGVFVFSVKQQPLLMKIRVT